MNERKMTEIDISSLIKNEVNHNTHLKNLILNINVKNPKIFSNLFHIFVIMSFSALMIMSTMIFLQLQELQTQMHSFMLMCQDKDNRSNYVEASNRFQRSADYNDSVPPTVSSTFKLSNQMEVRDDRRDTDAVTLMRYNQIVSDRSAYENNGIERNASGLPNVARTSLSKLMIYNFNKRQNFRRFETQNYTRTESEISGRGLIVWGKPRAGILRGRMKRAASEERRYEETEETRRRSEEESEKQRQSEKNEGTRLLQNEENAEERRSEEKSKTRRQSEKKGEKRRQNRRGHKHNRRRSRPLVATFIGAAPEVPEELTDTVYIGPWVKSKNKNHQYDLTKFHLVENNMSIQVGISGLYMISVQIYYFGHAMKYSYWILLNSEGSSMKRKLVTCATASFNNEVSCYTSTIIYLQKGDRLSLQQQEKNRLINMQDGYSQIQIMLLANDRRRST